MLVFTSYMAMVMMVYTSAGHPRYFNQLYSGLSETGIIAQMVSAATNTSV